MDSRYSNPDNDPRGPWASSDFTVKTASEAYMYPITTPSGRIVVPTASRSWVTSEENYLNLKMIIEFGLGKKETMYQELKLSCQKFKKELFVKQYGTVQKSETHKKVHEI